MADLVEKLAGIKDIIEPQALPVTQHDGWTFVLPVLVIGLVVTGLVYWRKSPLFIARRRYRNVLKHQSDWRADATGAELMAILILVPRIRNRSPAAMNSEYQQARELCNQLRFSGDLHQPETTRQALMLTQQILWSGK